MNKLAVVALGGNAILRNNQKGTIKEQEHNTYETLKNLLFLIKENYNLVITHGNGPQVGNIIMRNEAGNRLYQISQMPLDVCVADSQGGIGYVIERLLRNILLENNIKRDILTLVTQVVVDKNDNAFINPVKQIGKTYSKKEVNELTKIKGWIFKESKKSKGGWRRVVPSPMPKKIFNEKTIESNAKNGVIVIAAGGGGIPIYKDKNNLTKPIEAVIDKDLASSLLASEIYANELYILTDVPYVFLDYGKTNQKVAEFLNLEDTIKYYEEGQFGEGNMAPKILSAINFIKNGGDKAIITEATKLNDKRYGTKITLNYDLKDKPHNLPLDY
ncbi:carbamate kinase [Bacteroidota bacterium]